ncbi:MAG: hypothetical protein U0Q16_37735 [Bryobacteraceae bacterium]
MKRSMFTIFAAMALTVATGAALADDDDRDHDRNPVLTFRLLPHPKFVNCLKAPNGPTPTADVAVVRGKQNDTLVLRLKNIRPDLAFDMFTVQNTTLRSDGTVDPAFSNFGMAWYQSDVQADHRGGAEVQIKTILLDQIFGFDAATGLPPTNTFHVGIWFNDPKDAAACGFDVTKPTPFNGDHKAGPVAMISVTDPQKGVGPLCTKPGPNGSCNP